MARRGKTVIGERDLAQSAQMMRAQEAGTAARQRATEGLTRQHEAGLQQGLQAGQAASRALGSDLERKQHREIATGQQALEQQSLDLRAQAQGAQRTEDAPTAPLVDEAQQAKQGQEQPPQQEQEQEPQSREAGLGAAGGPSIHHQLPSLEEQKRAMEQAQTPVEKPGGRSFIPSAEGRQETAYRQAAGMGAVKAKIDNAKANMLNAQANYARATSRGGTQGAEGQAKAVASMVKSMETSKGLINDVMSGKVRHHEVAAAFADNPDMQQAATSAGPEGKAAVVRLLRSRLGSEQVSYMATTGLQPPDYDPDNPVTQRFNARFSEVAASFRSMQQEGTVSFDQPGVDAFEQAGQGQDRPMLSESWRGIKDYDSRNRFLRKVTARIMIEAGKLQSQSRGIAKASGAQQQISDLTGMVAERDAALQEYQQMFGQRPSERPRTEKETRYGTGPGGERVGGPVEVGIPGTGAPAAAPAREPYRGGQPITRAN